MMILMMATMEIAMVVLAFSGETLPGMETTGFHTGRNRDVHGDDVSQSPVSFESSSPLQ